MRKRQADIKTQFDRAPGIALLAPADTAPGFTASGVKQIVHRAYAGGAIVLPADPAQAFSPPNSPYLATRVGDDIGTASGKDLAEMLAASGQQRAKRGEKQKAAL